MDVDVTHWSGEGEFTQKLLDALKGIDDIAFVRVEDAPATRSEADYNFITNEMYVAFRVAERRERSRWLGVLVSTRRVAEKRLTMDALASRLAACEEIGPSDYSDGGMIQYLKTERVIPPYQTKGYKIVELVRIYEVDPTAQSRGHAKAMNL